MLKIIAVDVALLLIIVYGVIQFRKIRKRQTWLKHLHLSPIP